MCNSWRLQRKLRCTAPSPSSLTVWVHGSLTSRCQHQNGLPQASLWPPEPTWTVPSQCREVNALQGSWSDNATTLTPPLECPEMHATPHGSWLGTHFPALLPVPLSPSLQEGVSWGHVPDSLLVLEAFSWVLLLGVPKLRA